MTNVALVVLDTVRKDAFDDFFNWLPGTQFENAWATANYTVPSHASMFTGRYPSDVGVHAKSEQLSCDEPVLAERLKEAGYRTRAISGNLLASPVNGFDRGFEDFHLTGRARVLSNDIFPWQERIDAAPDLKFLRDVYLVLQCAMSKHNFLESLRLGWKIKNGGFSTVEETIDLVSQLEFEDQEFLFVNLMEAHAPYSVPNRSHTTGYNRRPIEDGIVVENDTELIDQKRAYLNSVKYLSEKYRKLFEMLDSEFDYVVTTSDHGELFGEHGTSKHYYGVFPELMQVPLSISGEGPTDSRIQEPVGIIDLYSTVLEVTNVRNSRDRIDLTKGEGRNKYFTESHGLRMSQYRSLVDCGFDSDHLAKIDRPLRGIAIPSDYYGYQHHTDGFIEHGDANVPSPREELDEFRKMLDYDPSEVDTAATGKMSEDVRRQLKDLGYM